MVRQIPLLKLIQTLFIKSDGISISNSPKKIEIDCYLDYRSYLVLLRLLYGADSFGIVIGCGIGEIERATGLSKQSIYRAIQQLKKIGFIRCQADGAIRNSFYSNRVSNIRFKPFASGFGGCCNLRQILYFEVPPAACF